ncbi:hypothetical protein [Blastopirellula marina]|uniref:Uncharacterized protein n=1 Tax=Blastopirellula marina TaxID=124 RepID=A0A2S8GD78_9BACT|nr:hypothetical protein [Blastopirellula marina]PQO42389.1 hypothetical protein C5Y93_29095 [Blastopirellula marina]
MAEQQEKIRVTCPGCFKRFEVSAKFAGKEGPCPNCKKPIRIPALDEQVVIREQEAFGGVKGAAGKLVFKPVAREDAKFSPVVLAVVFAATLSSFLVAYFVGTSVESQSTLTWILALGSYLVALPICWSGYWFLRDDEFEPYQGQELWARVAICAAAYALIWGIYAFLVGYWELSNDLGENLPYFVITAAVFVVMGSFAAAGSFDIQPLSGFLHFSFYILITLLLRMTMGLSAYYVNWWG